MLYLVPLPSQTLSTRIVPASKSSKLKMKHIGTGDGKPYALTLYVATFGVAFILFLVLYIFALFIFGQKSADLLFWRLPLLTFALFYALAFPFVRKRLKSI